MRPFATLVPPPQSVTISRIFILMRRLPAQGVPHDRFGSRRSRLRHAGAWPRVQRWRPTRRSSATISPTPRSSSKPGSRARRERSPSRRRRCGATPMPPSGATISATACRSSARSPRPARGQRKLAPARPHHLPDQAADHERADLLPGAGLDGGLHRLSAGRQPAGRGRFARRAGPRLRRPPDVAAGAGYAPALARHARGRRRPRSI